MVNWLSGLASLAGVFVAGIAVVMTHRTTRLNIEAQRNQASDQRLWAARSGLYIELLAYISKLEDYAIVKYLDASHKAFDPVSHESMVEELRASGEEVEEEYPPFPQSPPDMHERLALFASGAVDELVSLADAYAEVLAGSEFDQRQMTPDDFDTDMRKLRELVIETGHRATDEARREIQGHLMTARREVATTMSWHKTEVSVEGLPTWRGFISDRPLPGRSEATKPAAPTGRPQEEL